ncbi:hypothetical protein BO78DRAFT_418530 [Aspergillus sclerotiicarbonarius CBS 121057]|uniref:Uncharacterized protein n=1 Tax=Aspergillus sclerotiicarbonarius (strain CBS 121057 / IBT 28362) TaxID=1448318 RepID=A0A319EFY6_ASPSB|nr:hypothetical protein BO78DRAFT_418530 [Aspergillus sclerotiicarbonarius CBS 121057]
MAITDAVKALEETFPSQEDDGQIVGLMKDILGRIEAEAKEKGQATGFTFMNYASEFQDPVGSYGADNITC